MTVRELAQASGVKENTLVAAMVGETPGHDLVPVVKGYICLLYTSPSPRDCS